MTIPLIACNQWNLKHTNYQLTAEDDKQGFLLDAEGIFTLPEKIAGLGFCFFQTADNLMTIFTGAGDIIARNNAAAGSVAFQTAGQKIGACGAVRCVEVSPGNLAWLWFSCCNHTITVT